MQHNIWVNLVYSLLQAASSSLTLGAFFSNFIIVLGLKDEDVGFIYCVSGLVMVVLALPLGWLTDKAPKLALLRCGVVLGLLTTLLQSAALQLRSLPMIYIAAALSGATAATTGPPLASIFADSIATGARTKLYTLQYSASLSAGSLGPLAAIVFFHLQGNEWRLPLLTLVMQAGNVLAFASYLLLLLIRDADALGAESEGVLVAGSEGGGGAGAGAEAGAAGDAEAPLLPASPAPPEDAALGLGHQTCPCLCLTLRVRHIPVLLFLSDITIALGAGATVAFFPLYFSTQLSFSPIGLSGIFAAVPLLVAIAGLALVPVSGCIGRAWAAMAANALGTAALFALCTVQAPWLAVLTYLLRTALMNASYAVQRGILMDVVSKGSRGRWSSLANLTAATWSGSSLVGGLLVDRFSFRAVFFGTACVYCLGMAWMAPVIFLTKGERVDKDKAPAKVEASVNASE